MSDADTVMMDLVWGHGMSVQVTEYRDGRLWIGGYTIWYGRDGKETSRTPLEWHCSLGCDDGTPLTKAEAARLTC